MTISTSQIQPLLKAGLGQIFLSKLAAEWWINNPKPFIETVPVAWRTQYEKYRHLFVNSRAWEQFLAKHTPAVRARLEELNPNGCEPGRIPRGWHQKFSSRDVWVHGLVAAGAYQKHWGYAPLADHIVKHNGRKKYVSQVDYAGGTAHAPVGVRR